MEAQYLPCVNPGDRHHPLYKFLTEEPEMDEFKEEIRTFPVCLTFSVMGIAMQRKDI